MTARAHSFRLDDDRADVVVRSIVDGVPGLTHRHPDTPTLTCSGCGLRLAWVAASNGRVSAAYGIELDALVRTGRALPRCEPAAVRACDGARMSDHGSIYCDDGACDGRCGKRRAPDVAPVSVGFEVDQLAETYCYATIHVQVRLPLDAAQAQALDCDEVARAVADALRCHVACPECRGVGRDHKLRCSRRADAGLALGAERS